MRKNSGFTLIEVLLVIGLIGICAAMAAPSIGRLITKNRLENQVRRIYSDLMNARVLAMSTNRIHFFVFAGNTWNVLADTNNNGNNDGAPADTIVLRRSAVDIAPSFTLSKAVPQNAVIVNNVGNWIAFNARGIASTGNAPNGTISITVPAGITPYVDCISVTPIMMRLGKLTGGACVSR